MTIILFDSPVISIVITSFNRLELVVRAIGSALDFINELGQGEIVIVDDCSTDLTVVFINEQYKWLLETGRITLIQHKLNLGVTAAKNSGARVAKGDWVLFLDSDDKLLSSSALKISKITNSAPVSCPIIFCRCINEDGQLIGPLQSDEYFITLKMILLQGTPGECLPVIRRTLFSMIKYDEDLRGFESITYSKMIKAFGPALLSTVVVRVYMTENQDRLCNPSNIKKRGCLISLGYCRMFILFNSTLGIKGSILILAKSIFHFIRCLKSKAIS